MRERRAGSTGIRDGDYIGGPVESCAANRPMGGGGHTRYWNDPQTLDSDCRVEIGSGAGGLD